MSAVPVHDLAVTINEEAHSKGFYTGDDGEPVKRNTGEVLMLMVSELAEALEEHRAGRAYIYIEKGKPEGELVELADCVIRCLDTMAEYFRQHGPFAAEEIDGDMAKMVYSIDDIIDLKLAYNRSRPYKHGKAY